MSLTRRGLQPYGWNKRWQGVEKSTKSFLTKTVMVIDNDVDSALQVMNKSVSASVDYIGPVVYCRNLSREGVMGIMRRVQRFEKPFLQRSRLNHETCKAIYDEDMRRKIQFISRKNRLDPYPGQY